MGQLANASPRNPKVVTVSKSSSTLSLLVANIVHTNRIDSLANATSVIGYREVGLDGWLVNCCVVNE